jgi:hypothetical protein
MSVEYTSRSGKLYYLHIEKTKNGNDKYFFSSKKDGNLAQNIPNGYEIYENVNAQVFLRRIQPKIIFDEELEIIEKELQKQTKPHHYKYEAKKNIITVYEINQDLEGLTDSFPFTSKSRIEEHILRSATYTPIMRFILEDKVKRLFSAERFCFMGGIDDWIYIGVTDSLGKQAKKFIKHLGKDSFFELYRIA